MGVLERTKKVVAECLGKETADIKSDSRLVPDLGADSIDLLELIFLLEKEFDAPLNTDEFFPDRRDDRKRIVECLTVADIAAVLERKLHPA